MCVLCTLIDRAAPPTLALAAVKADCASVCSMVCRQAAAMETLVTCWLSARDKNLLSHLGTPSQAPDARIHAAVMEIFPTDAVPFCANEPTADESESMRLAQVKGSPPSSLLSLLVKHMLTLPTAGTMAMLWLEFLREIRWHWDNAVTIARLAHALPDFSCCIIHQKLQQINLCIERQKRVIEGAPPPPS